MSDLNEQDATKLFNELTKAMQDEDSNKLSELLATEASEEGAPVEKEPPEELSEEEKEEEQPETEDKEEDSPPEEKEEAGEPVEKKEPTAEEKALAELKAQLDAVKKENQNLRSQAGRVPSMQRKMAELDKKLEALKASPSSQTSAKIKPKLDKLLEGVKDTDPALADTIAQAIAAAIEGVDEEARTRETETLTLLREQEQLEYQQEQVAKLTAMFPNAGEVFASPHWAEWKKTQPKHILEMALSDNADAVAMAFELYAKDMKAKYPQLAEAAEKTTVESKITPNEEDVEKAKKLEQERLRKQKSEATLANGKQVPRPRDTSDPAALFAKYSDEIRKEIRGT